MATAKKKLAKRANKANKATATPMMDKQRQTESGARILIDAEKRLSAAQSHVKKQTALMSKIGKVGKA
jgi:hypothetical protein